MKTHLLDGKALAFDIKKSVNRQVKILKEKGIIPTLAVVLVGDDPASHIYVEAKRRQCTEVGIHSRQLNFPSHVSLENLVDTLQQLNEDSNVHGILVQLPLPKKFDPYEIINCLAPAKDVDGLSASNVGKLLTKNEEGFIPCTPQGILHLIKSTGQPLAGKQAVVVGRSMLVGLPTAHLLINENCTVTVAHSYTLSLRDICQSADILVVACGQPQLIQGSWIKPGAIVIDVGIHRTPQGLVGDVAYHQALGIAGYLSPVPGGVGPLTVAFLLSNTVIAANRTLI